MEKRIYDFTDNQLEFLYKLLSERYTSSCTALDFYTKKVQDLKARYEFLSDSQKDLLSKYSYQYNSFFTEVHYLKLILDKIKMQLEN
jgi:hypothetical protein